MNVIRCDTCQVDIPREAVNGFHLERTGSARRLCERREWDFCSVACLHDMVVNLGVRTASLP